MTKIHAHIVAFTHAYIRQKRLKMRHVNVYTIRNKIYTKIYMTDVQKCKYIHNLGTKYTKNVHD
jgi:hypothetical protein